MRIGSGTETGDYGERDIFLPFFRIGLARPTPFLSTFAEPSTKSQYRLQCSSPYVPRIGDALEVKQ